MIIRILIADDHPVVFAGMQKILDTTPAFRLTGQVHSDEELLLRLASGRDQYDIVVLEISMSGKEVVHIIREIRATYPDLPVVIFTRKPEIPYALRCIKLGASAFIRKDSQPEEIIHALKTVSGGKNHYTPHQIELMAESIRGTTGLQDLSLDELTNRELQVLHLLANGLSKGEIAHKLTVSKHTLSNHRNNILKKLNLRNNAELTRYAIQTGLIS
jgi:DNA-binding NarL/FixJ family response regulator